MLKGSFTLSPAQTLHLSPSSSRTHLFPVALYCVTMNSSSSFKALMFGNELRSASAQMHFIIHYIVFFPVLQCLALLAVQVESQNK